MSTTNFEEKVKLLKKLHLLGTITGVLAVAGLFIAPISDYFAEEGTPYLIKTVLMLICLTDIPLLYSLYQKKVIEKRQSAFERQDSFIKWTYARMAIWLMNVLLCMLAYHFDTDALTNKLSSTILMGIMCLAVYIFLAKVRPEDAEEK